MLPEAFLETCQSIEGSETILVQDMHTRKQEFLKNSNAFICLPGGFGTLEELLECITWKQLGIHHHPIIVYDPTGYFDPIQEMIKKGQAEGFINHSDLVSFTSSLDNVLALLAKGDDPSKSLKLKWNPIVKM